MIQGLCELVSKLTLPFIPGPLIERHNQLAVQLALVQHN